MRMIMCIVDEPGAIDRVKAECVTMGYGPDTHKIIRRDGLIMVMEKKE